MVSYIRMQAKFQPTCSWEDPHKRSSTRSKALVLIGRYIALKTLGLVRYGSAIFSRTCYCIKSIYQIKNN